MNLPAASTFNYGRDILASNKEKYSLNYSELCLTLVDTLRNGLIVTSVKITFESASAGAHGKTTRNCNFFVAV